MLCINENGKSPTLLYNNENVHTTICLLTLRLTQGLKIVHVVCPFEHLQIERMNVYQKIEKVHPQKPLVCIEGFRIIFDNEDFLERIVDFS